MDAGSIAVPITRVRLLLAAMVRVPELYTAYSLNLAPQHIEDAGLSYLYLRLRELSEDTNRNLVVEPVTAVELKEDVRSQLTKNPNLLDSEDKAELQKFLKQGLKQSYCKEIFDDKKLLFKLTRQTVQALLEYAIQQDTIENLRTADPAGSLEVLNNALGRMEEVTASLGSNEPRLTFPKDWDKRPVYTYVSTGMPFLNEILDGGMCAKEVNIFMAPYGTCKTSLATHLLVNGAWDCYAAYLQQQHLAKEDRRKGIAILVSYEALPGELQYRIAQCAARIEFDSIKNMGTSGISALAGAGVPPKPYEEKYFKDEIANGIFVPERERLELAMPWLNEHSLMLDFTTSQGSGGVPEIAAEIAKELHTRGPNCYVHSVSVDYAGLLVSRLLEATTGPGKKPEEHKLLPGLVNELRRKVAIAFETPVLLFHQLTGVANRKGSKIRVADKVDAKGAAAFAEHAANAVVASHLTEDGVGLMSNQKFRRSSVRPPVAFRLYGAMCRLDAATDYTVDMSGALTRKVDGQPDDAGQLGMAEDDNADQTDIIEDAELAAADQPPEDPFADLLDFAPPT